MIESRLDPILDGTGGGYGKYAGLTVAQIAERFRYLVEEGQGRSARAILRMVHEQTEARGSLGTQRYLVVIAATIATGLVLFRLVVADEARSKLDAPIMAAVGATVLFGVGAVSVHRATVRAEAQVREIHRLALASLDILVSRPDFRPKGLEREHESALRLLKRVDPSVWAVVKRSLSPDTSPSQPQ